MKFQFLITGYRRNPKVDYGKYGRCEECGNKNTGEYWCLQCNSQCFQQNFGIGQVERKILMQLFKSPNQQPIPSLNGFHIPYLKTKYIDKRDFGKIYSVI